MSICAIYSQLLEQYQRETQAYSHAVNELSKVCVGFCAVDLYNQKYAVSQEAGKRSKQARMKLDGHIQEHGCGCE